MAKIQYSGLGVTDARGSIGGNTLSRNKSGAYAKKKTVGINPNSPAQQAVRAIFATIQNGWRDLTAALRSGWNENASEWPQTDSLGNVFFLSGQQLYSKLNNSLMQVGLAPIAIAPLPGVTYSPNEMTVANSNAAQTLDFTLNDPINAGVIPAGQELAVYVTPPLSAGIANADSKFDLLTTFAAGNGSNFDISAAYTAKYGVIPVDSKIFVKTIAVATATGQRGTELSNSAIAV